MSGLSTVAESLLSGRYELRSVLGRGGMGEVWLAFDRRLSRPVAVKIVRPADSDDPALPERFEREARIAARLSHPNIVGVYDVGLDGPTPYLVMELVQGHSLADELASGPLEPRRAVSIAQQVCEALAAAHAAGVVHRDVKPANILLTGADLVKVCDFGIARVTDAAQAALTGSAMVIGTSAYMAPEQVAGRPVDARTDLYALGCVLYAMLAGRPPFAGDTPIQVAWQHVNEAPVPLPRLRPDLPPPLAALAGALLAKQPADRPANALQVRDALAAIGGPVSAQPTATLRQARPDGAAATSVMPGPPAGGPIRGSAPVRASTRTMPRLDGPAAPRKTGRRTASAGLALVALGAAAVAALTFAVRSDHGGTPAAGPPAASASSTAQPSAEPTSQAPTSDAPSSPEPSDSAPASPADPVAAVRAAVAQEAGDGTLDSGAARELTRRLDALARDIGNGNDDRAAIEVASLRGRLDQLNEDGRLTGDGYSSVLASVEQLAATLPTPPATRDGQRN